MKTERERTVENLIAVAVLLAAAYLIGLSTARPDDYPAAADKTRPRAEVPAVPEEDHQEEPAELVPVRQTEKLPPPPAQAEAIDRRPLVYLYAPVKGCSGAEEFWREYQRGALPEFNIVREKSPPWARICPTLHFQASDGSWKRYPETAALYRGTDGFREAYDRFNAPPEIETAPGAAGPSGSSIADLFTRFAGPGKFSWTPDKPVAVYVDAGTYLKYTRIAGTAKVVNGQPAVKFDDPKPMVGKKYGLWWWATVDGTTSDLSASPPTVTLQTSRGNFTVEVKEAP